VANCAIDLFLERPGLSQLSFLVRYSLRLPVDPVEGHILARLKLQLTAFCAVKISMAHKYND